VAPNAVADATAKTYLAADHGRLIARDLAKYERRRLCVYVQADTQETCVTEGYIAKQNERVDNG